MQVDCEMLDTFQVEVRISIPGSLPVFGILQDLDFGL